MILFKNVYKNEKNISLKDLSFQINKGEFVYIYAQNSLSLKLLLELLTAKKKVDKGQISWCGRNYLRVNLLKTDMGIVYQDNILLSQRSIKDNLSYIMEIKGLSQSYFINRVNKVLNFVELRHCADLKPKDLSLHQLIRANIAQAILNFPSIIIMNNPFLNLDEVNLRSISHLLERINNNSMTIIFLTSSKQNIILNKKRVISLEKSQTTEKKQGSYA